MRQKDSEKLAEIEAREKLRAKGYSWKNCKSCCGTGHASHGYKCFACGGRGGYWQAPIMR